MICDDPNARVLFFLSTDLHRPKESRPAFVCKPLTRRQSRAKRERLAEAAKAKTVDDAYELYLDVIMDGVVDWRNVNQPDGTLLPFTRENLGEVLGDNELSELARTYDHFDEVDVRG